MLLNRAGNAHRRCSKKRLSEAALPSPLARSGRLPTTPTDSGLRGGCLDPSKHCARCSARLPGGEKGLCADFSVRFSAGREERQRAAKTRQLGCRRPRGGGCWARRQRVVENTTSRVRSDPRQGKRGAGFFKPFSPGEPRRLGAILSIVLAVGPSGRLKYRFWCSRPLPLGCTSCRPRRSFVRVVSGPCR